MTRSRRVGGLGQDAFAALDSGAARLVRFALEQTAVPGPEELAAGSVDDLERLTHEEWPAVFEVWARWGAFDGMPEFPAALLEYRRALDEARAGAVPFDPPRDFLPAEPSWLRLQQWRQGRFPAVDAAWERLMRMAAGAVRRC